MPQLVPFFFTHQIILVFFALAFLLGLFSKYILPNILSIFLGRYTLGYKINS
jgi:F0F1-type ATP synthase membrane subunit b/b'